VVQTGTVYDANGGAAYEKGATAVNTAAKDLAASLIGGGGRAASPTASTVVKCTVVNAAKPVAVPSSGGI
jgi:hypothetical protein